MLGSLTSNGFREKAFLFVVIMVSIGAADVVNNSPWLTLWYLLLGCATLYLAYHFDIFSFTSEDWAANEATEWSARTLDGAPNEFIDRVAEFREKIVPGPGIFWWFFRIVYLVMGLQLVAIGLERLYYGTDYIRQFTIHTLVLL